MTDLTPTLHARGQRVTTQRVEIDAALRRIGRHATAEEVLHAATPALPGLSLPTVYATLELFEELGIVRRIAARADAVLYDPRTDEHHHFVCRACGVVEDLEGGFDTSPALEAARVSGATPERADLVVFGRCRGCSPAG